MTTLHTYELTCEYAANPLGVDTPQPRLSWKLRAQTRNARQTAYRVIVTARPIGAQRKPRLVWDSGVVRSAQSLHVAYAGAPLQPLHRYEWQVQVWDEARRPSSLSEPAFWETGLMNMRRWKAHWITPGWDDDPRAPIQQLPMLRRVFHVSRCPAAARLCITSLGVYEAHLNGRRVGDAVLTPGWTSYHKRLQYQVWDVTSHLVQGENVIGAWLGNGWYRSQLGFGAQKHLYGSHLALLAQLHIFYDDGSSDVICTDAHWRAAPSPVVFADVYNGETYDARLEQAGWCEPRFDDREWSPVRILGRPRAQIVAQESPLVQVHETLSPQRVLRAPNGEVLLDFGQNLVGVVQMFVQGAAGTTVTLRHGEALDADGNLYTANLRSAAQTTRYTLKGAATGEFYTPRFTFMGFRYVAVSGYPGEVKPEHFAAMVLHSALPRTGQFECSNPLLNQLQHNILWGQKGNFLDIPTDCPQRDERLGWTGDAQVFARTASFNMHTARFFAKWLRDLRADQSSDGAVPVIAPDIIGQRGVAGWSDALILVPWTLYTCFGDTRILAELYDGMVAWVRYVESRLDADGIWRRDFQYADWLDYRGENPLTPRPVTNPDLIATAFFAHSVALLARIARVLGRRPDARRFEQRAARAREAFVREFVTAGGRIGPDTQTAYALALAFDLLPEAMRKQAAERLARLISENGYRLTTGFLGTPHLCHVLTRFGYADVAYELLNQERYPSWLYPLHRGATTIWERWDGIRLDGTFQDPGMNSFNHYAYGAIGDWLYRVAGGIELDPEAPAYRRVVVRPRPGGGLDWARAALEAPYGRIAVDWHLSRAGFHVNVELPPNTEAEVHVPARALTQVTESYKPLNKAPGVLEARLERGTVIITVGSGSYHFFTRGLSSRQAMAGVRHIAGRLDRYAPLYAVLNHQTARETLARCVDLEALLKRADATWLNAPLADLPRYAPDLIAETALVALERALLTLTTIKP